MIALLLVSTHEQITQWIDDKNSIEKVESAVDQAIGIGTGGRRDHAHIAAGHHTSDQGGQIGAKGHTDGQDDGRKDGTDCLVVGQIGQYAANNADQDDEDKGAFSSNNGGDDAGHPR